MKKHYLVLILLMAGQWTFGQHSCCVQGSATETFAMLTQDQHFIDTHQEPENFKLANPIGADITFKTADGKDGHAYEIKAETATNNYVFVIHEWWGLNDQVKKESEKIYKTLGNVNVIALDLYDHNVATTRDSAAKYMQSVKTERAIAIINGAIRYAGKKAKIATIGWCFGGGWSMQTSLLAGKKSKACVMYYGMPEEKMERIKTLKSPIFFVFAEQDQWINKEMVEKFKTNMTTARKSLTVASYNADHAFANPSNPQFQKEFTEDAFKKATDFIASHLK